MSTLQVELRPCSFADVRPYRKLMTAEHVVVKDDGATLIGAWTGGTLVGVVGYRKVKNVTRYLRDWVHPNYRRQGIFSALWEVREEATKDATVVTAFATSMSLPMYIAAGFGVINTNRFGISFVRRRRDESIQRLDAGAAAGEPSEDEGRHSTRGDTAC